MFKDNDCPWIINHDDEVWMSKQHEMLLYYQGHKENNERTKRDMKQQECK